MNHHETLCIKTNTSSSFNARYPLSRRMVLLGLVGAAMTACGQNPKSSIGSSTTATAIPSTTTPSTNQPLLTYPNGGWAVSWSPDGKRIASGRHGKNNNLEIWDANTGKTLLTYTGHTDPVEALAWSPDGQFLASGSSANTNSNTSTTSIQIWHASTKQKRLTYSAHTYTITQIAWSPDGTRIASAALDGTARIWDPLTGKTIHILENNPGQAFLGIQALSWSPDGNFLVTGDYSSGSGGPYPPLTVKVWDTHSGKASLTLDTPGAALAWSPQGNTIAIGQGQFEDHSEAAIHFWDAISGKKLGSLQAIYTVLSLAWSPNGKYIASGGGDTQAEGSDNQVQVWDVSRGKNLHTFKGGLTFVSSLSWSPDSTRIVVGSAGDMTIPVWQAIP
ncbi:hypothetical protein KSF_000190 [Reticulibacter mediterranei]|uniref:Translation initiation factor beta propellor-like domain-containing protein n=1 Tax=Reticulibacter mediterranei TaxID=2778369 RepID=A0A8J3IGS8_9CHLR|nr:WD40 repeat domain-containing protein [Reticulibacter mediterranei]GHO89971.1 hypothetical protein KSF_000190 [Reticulibacter mediterranei]